MGWAYAGLAFVGHLSALAYIPLLPLVPVMLLIPWPRLVLPLAVFLASVLLSFLLLDSLVFAENRYHLGVLTFSMLEPQTWAFLALYFLLGVAVEAMVALLDLEAYRKRLRGAGSAWCVPLAPRRLPAGEQSHPRVGRGALLRAGDRIHAIPAALPPAHGRAVW